MCNGARWRSVGLALLLATAAALGAASTASAQSGGGIEADGIVVRVAVQPNGTAVWEMEYRYLLGSPNRSEAFQRLRTTIHEQRSDYVADVRSDFAAVVRAAENDTGRNMTLANVSVDTQRQSIPQDTGIVVHRFVWEGFAVANDTHVVAGDAIRGFYVGPRTELVVTWPERYRAMNVEPPPDERATGEQPHLTWTDGRFASDEPRLVFAHQSTVSDGVSPLTVGAAVVLVLAGAVGGGAVYLRRNGRGSDESERSRIADRRAAGGAAAGGGEDGPPPELLSDEELVRRVLDEHGGRVKQQTLAAECDWGESKTSKVVTRLHDEGAIERFRIGRENVIADPAEGLMDDQE